MNKKAQVERIFVWFLAIIMLALILFFGYNAIAKTTQKGCEAQLILFEKRFTADIESMYAQQGSVVEKSYSVPCGVDRIYFVDIGRDVSFSSLSDYPEIMDSLNVTGTGKNVFLIKGGEVYRSFSGGDMEIANPYFDCYITKTGALGLFLEGKAGRTGILKKNDRFDCTFTEPLPVELDTIDLEAFLDETGEYEIKEDCEVTRTITLTDEGYTNISIQNCDEDNLFFENIPTCALETLNDLGVIKLSPDEATLIKSGPLIMWSFAAGDVKSYEIKKAIELNCKTEFEGIAVEVVEEADTVDTPSGDFDLDELYNALDNIHHSLSGPFEEVRRKVTQYQDDSKFKHLKDAIKRIDEILDKERLEGDFYSSIRSRLEDLKGSLELLIPEDYYDDNNNRGGRRND